MSFPTPQPRIRTVKPEFFLHGDLYDVDASLTRQRRATAPGLARLAFAGLWCHADREGRFKWRPRELKVKILPHDTVDFEAILDALRDAGFLGMYESDGEIFGVVLTLKENQVINNREKDSQLPPPPADRQLWLTGNGPVNVAKPTRKRRDKHAPTEKIGSALVEREREREREQGKGTGTLGASAPLVRSSDDDSGPEDVGPLGVATLSEPTFATVCRSKGVGAGLKLWRCPVELSVDLAKSFPSIDLAQELRKAAAWLSVNGTNRKTQAGMSSFLWRWCEKAQNDTRTHRSPASERNGNSAAPQAAAGKFQPKTI